MVDKIAKGAVTKVLDKGFIKVIDFMGSDEDVVDAARISYGSSNTKKSSTATLINYLMKHNHTSPFEMCEIKLHIKMPIFVARQWMRHRAGHFNEISGRYTEMHDDFYTPDIDTINRQCPDNKQSRANTPAIDPAAIRYSMQKSMNQSYESYKSALDKATAREVARIVMPLSSYTEIFWKVDLHNFMKFIQLRIASNSQLEMQEYATALRGIFLLWCPLAHAAFTEYRLHANYFSATQSKLLQQLLRGNRPAISDTGLNARDYNHVIDFVKLHIPL